jgi:signal transduction histidine kinase
MRLLVVALLATGWLRGAEPGGEALRTARQVRELSPGVAGKQPSARLAGVVLGQAEPDGESLVLWDGTDSIYVVSRAEEIGGLGPGDTIEARGHVLAGTFAPYVQADKVTKTGTASLPEPAPVAAEDLFTKGLDAQWIIVTGVVRDLPPTPTDTPTKQSPAGPAALEPRRRFSGRTMTLAIGDRLVPVQFYDDVAPARYIDAEVEIRGLCFNLHNAERQFLKPLILVPRGIEIRIVRPPSAKPFELPAVSSLSLFQFQREGTWSHRVRIDGTVLHHMAGTGMWVRDAGHGFFVHTDERTPLAPGDLVQVVGFPERGEFAPELAHAIYHKVGHEAEPAPLPLQQAGEAAKHNADLIMIEGILLDRKETPQGLALRLGVQGQSVDMICTGSDQGWSSRELEPGSLLSVTGICLLSVEHALPASGLFKPEKFSLLVRKPADIVMRRAAPWWTPGRVAMVLASVTGALAIVLATLFAISRRKLARERALRALKASEYAARLAERSRMAREIHDRVAQGLGAVSLQLQLAECGPLSGEQARHLGLARQLVITSMTEVRGFIRNLRTQAHQDGDLASVLEEQLRHAVATGQIRPVFECLGEVRKWPPPVEEQVVRIAQEAMTNAVQHAGAGTLSLHLRFTSAAVVLTVADDGRGFDPAADWARRGHFGVLGMHERAALIGATFEIDRPAAGGTRVRLTVPASARLTDDLDSP